MTREHRARLLTPAATIILLVLPLSAQEPQKWLHLQVVDGNTGTGDLALNIPLRMVSAFLATVPSEHLSEDGELTVDERHGASITGLREMWHEVKEVDDVEFFTAQHGDETVRMSRTGSLLELWLESDQETVQVEMPMVVLDALLMGDGETLNLSAAIDELTTLEGDIVRASRVGHSEQQLRVWIDDQNIQ